MITVIALRSIPPGRPSWWRVLLLLVALATAGGAGGKVLAGEAAGEPQPESGRPTADAGAARVRIPAEIPVRREHQAGASGAAPVRALLLASVLLVAVFVLFKLRRRAGAPQGEGPSGRGGWRRWLASAPSSGSLRLLQSARLTPRASVHVVQWDGKEWLVGCGDQSVTVLGQRSAAAEPPGGARAGDAQGSGATGEGRA